MGISEATYYSWKKRYMDLDLLEIREPRQLRDENAFIESSSGRLRDECLNVNEFATLDEARLRLQAWRQDYNHHRPHRSLGRLTPSEFAARGRKSGSELPKVRFQVLRKNRPTSPGRCGGHTDRANSGDSQ